MTTEIGSGSETSTTLVCERPMGVKPTKAEDWT
jgi:hypothetical protein